MTKKKTHLKTDKKTLWGKKKRSQPAGQGSGGFSGGYRGAVGYKNKN